MSTTNEHPSQEGHEEVEEAEEHEESRLRGSRRTFMKGIGVAAGAGMAGGAAVHPQSPVSMVGNVEAVAPLVVAAGAGAIGVATGAGGTAGYVWYTSDDVEDRETATAGQVHRDIHSITRGLDSAYDEEENAEELTVEQTSHRVWGEAVHEFAVAYNDEDEDRSVSELESEFRQYIRDEYAEIQKEIIGNYNLDMRELIDAFARIYDYEETDSVSDMVQLNCEVRGSGSTFNRTHNFGETRWYLDSDGEEDVSQLFAVFEDEVPEGVEVGFDGVVQQEDALINEYTLVNDEAVDFISWWNSEGMDVLPYTWSGASDQIKIDGDTLERVEEDGERLYHDGGSRRLTRLHEVEILPPDDAEMSHHIVHFSDRLRRIEVLEEEANDLAGEVSEFVDGVTSQYARGELPVQQITPYTTLVDEYGYEEGNAGLMALYLAGSGFETNLNSPVVVTHYGDDYTATEVEDGEPEDGDGTELEGYLRVEDTPEDGIQQGETYDSVGEVNLITSAGISELGTFRVEDIRDYDTEGADADNIETDDDGREYVTRSEFDQQRYNFQSRDPDMYADDIEANQDVRENAASVEPAGGSGLVNISFDGSNRWLYAIPGVGVVLALVYAFSQED